jgi:hypothetical protein
MAAVVPFKKRATSNQQLALDRTSEWLRIELKQF